MNSTLKIPNKPEYFRAQVVVNKLFRTAVWAAANQEVKPEMTYIKVPNEMRYVAAMAMTLPRNMTQDFLLEIGAVKQSSIVRAQAVLAWLQGVRDELNKQLPNGHNGWVMEYIIGSLVDSDGVAYLAYLLENSPTAEGLMLSVLGRMGYASATNCRMWESHTLPEDGTYANYLKEILEKVRKPNATPE